jgi:hypothetical protein
MDADTAQKIIASLKAGNALVCYARCEPCQFGGCPGGPHPWAGAEDIAHALKTGGDASGTCACSCVLEPELDQDDIDGMHPVVSLNADPCPLCGEVGPCAYDAEGRPLIHAQTEPEDDE